MAELGRDELPEPKLEHLNAFDRVARDLNAHLEELELRVSAVEAGVDAVERCLDDLDEPPARSRACALIAPLAFAPRLLARTASTIIQITAKVGAFATRMPPASVLRREQRA